MKQHCSITIMDSSFCEMRKWNMLWMNYYMVKVLLTSHLWETGKKWPFEEKKTESLIMGNENSIFKVIWLNDWGDLASQLRGAHRQVWRYLKYIIICIYLSIIHDCRILFLFLMYLKPIQTHNFQQFKV